jgi:hypothetical protein
MSLAQSCTAGYIMGKYGYPASDYLGKNPGIKTLRMINYSAGDVIKELEAQKAATGFLHYFESIMVAHHDEYDLVEAMSSLTTLIKSGSKKAQELGKVIDRHYRFLDEQ